MANQNPRTDHLTAFRYHTDREEPLREKLQLRIPLSMKQEIYAQENWQEFVRQAIAEKLKSA